MIMSLFLVKMFGARNHANPKKTDTEKNSACFLIYEN